ncbi:hypothetical protein [Mucilaginibacter sp.]|uniref:hypothetical protein n=1 Tax=Mucilaginibacter sp. TaxID=1882438 RepID=UPI003AFFA493
MKDTIFLFFKVVIQTSHTAIRDAVKELETEATYFIGNTKNVQVLETEIIKLNTDHLGDGELN